VVRQIDASDASQAADELLERSSELSTLGDP
jgi:hypothetical protein